MRYLLLMGFLFAAPAAAQDSWVGYRPPTPPPGQPIFLNQPLTGNEYLEVQCNGRQFGSLPRCANIGNPVGVVAIPIGEFARSSALAGVADDLSALRATVDALAHRTDRNINRSAALSAVLDAPRPQGSASNRLGIATSDFEGRSAVGLNYSRRMGNYDVGMSLGTAGSYQAGAVSAGFSW